LTRRTDVRQPVEAPVPQNIAAEEATLGALLIDGHALGRLAFLRPAHFYAEKNGWIFQAIQNLAARGEPLDILTICDELNRQGRLDAVDGSAYVTSLLNATPTALHLEHYARLVHRAAIRRELVARAGQIARLAYEAAGPAEAAVRQAQALLAGLLEDGSPPGGAVRVGAALAELAAAGPLGTGLPGLDAQLTGLWPGQVVGLADRAPARVAAALAHQVALHQALRGAAVVILAPHTSRAELAGRLWGQVAGLAPERLRDDHLTPAEQRQAARAQELLAAAPLYLDDTPALAADLAGRLRPGWGGLEVRLAVVETAPGGATVGQALRQAARSARVPLLAVAPDAADWADVGLACSGVVDNPDQTTQNIVLVVLRQGVETGRVALCFDRATRRFTNGNGARPGQEGT